MKKILLAAVFLCVAVLFIISCGSKGPAGPAGSSGNNGPVTVNLQNNAIYSGTTDTYLDSYNSGTNNSSAPGIYAGFYAGYNNDNIRAILRFDLSTVIPSNVIVEAAYLTLYPYNCGSTCISGSATITAYAVSDPWTMAGATWLDSQVATLWTNAGGDFSQTPMSNTLVLSAANIPTSVMFTLDASVIQGWLATPSTNYGLILKASNETTGNNFFGFYSTANGTAALNPILTLYYKLQ